MFILGILLFAWGVIDFVSFNFFGYDVYWELFNIELTGFLFSYSAYLFMLAGGLLIKFSRK